MVTIVYNNVQQKFAVYKDGKKVLVVNYGVEPKAALSMFGISGPVQEFEKNTDADFSDTLDTNDLNSTQPVDNEEALKNAIAAVSFGPNKTREKMRSKLGANDLGPDAIKNAEELNEDNSPDAQIFSPLVGTDVYVEDARGTLTSIKGGKGKVKMAYLTGQNIPVAGIGAGYENEEEEEEDDEDRGPNDQGLDTPEVLIEFEQLPGRYFNYTMVMDMQDELAKKFGDTEVSVVSNF